VSRARTKASIKALKSVVLKTKSITIHKEELGLVPN